MLKWGSEMPNTPERSSRKTQNITPMQETYRWSVPFFIFCFLLLQMFNSKRFKKKLLCSSYTICIFPYSLSFLSSPHFSHYFKGFVHWHFNSCMLCLKSPDEGWNDSRYSRASCGLITQAAGKGRGLLIWGTLTVLHSNDLQGDTSSLHCGSIPVRGGEERMDYGLAWRALSSDIHLPILKGSSCFSHLKVHPSENATAYCKDVSVSYGSQNKSCSNVTFCKWGNLDCKLYRHFR